MVARVDKMSSKNQKERPRIRAATPEDAAPLSKMNQLFNHLSIGLRDIQKKLRDGDEIVLVAQSGEGLCGFACAQVMDSFCYKKPYAELTELYVGSAYRRNGIATMLVRSMEKELSKRGVVHIHILTGVANRPARALYEQLRYSCTRKRPEILYDKNMKR